MIPKENILNAWIMCDHLSEENIHLKDNDFFLRIINEELDRIRSSSKKAGIIVYFNSVR